MLHSSTYLQIRRDKSYPSKASLNTGFAGKNAAMPDEVERFYDELAS